MTRTPVPFASFVGLLLAACQGGGSGPATTTAGPAVAATSGSGGTTSAGASTSSTGTTTSSTGTTTGQLQGYVDTLAGGSYGSNCKSSDAGYFSPLQVAIGPAGSLYATMEGPLYQIAPDGGITVLLTDEEAVQVMGGDGARGIAVGLSGSILLAPGGDIFRLTGTTLSFFAGNASGECYDTASGMDGGVGFLDAQAMTVDSVGNVFVADNGSFKESDPHGCTRIQKVAPDGTITTVAGNGFSGFADGPPDVAAFFDPNGIAVDQAGYLYVADTSNNRIRKIAPDGTTSTLAGNGNRGFDDGTGGPNGTATFNNPIQVAVDAAGFVYVTDGLNNSVRQVAPDGTTTTVAGNGQGGFFDGTLGKNGTTQFNEPYGIAVNPQGDTIYVADGANCRVRVIHLTGAGQ